MPIRPRVAILSPWHAETAEEAERNRRYALAAMAHSLSLGHAPFAPHLLYPQVLDDDDPAARTVGMECGREWFFDAQRVTAYLDLGWSDGMLADVEWFRRHRPYMTVESRRLGDGWESWLEGRPAGEGRCVKRT